VFSVNAETGCHGSGAFAAAVPTVPIREARSRNGAWPCHPAQHAKHVHAPTCSGRGDRHSFEPLVRKFLGAVLKAAEDRAPLLAAVALKPPTEVHHVKQKFRRPI
jgi:hypothetical protein